MDPRTETKRRYSFDGGRIVLALLVLILCYQVVIPLLMIMWTSFKVARPGEPGFFSFSLSVTNYARAFGSKNFWTATWNTARFALASASVSFALGTFLAWVVHRTDTPLAKLINILTLAILTLAASSFLLQ